MKKNIIRIIFTIILIIGILTDSALLIYRARAEASDRSVSAAVYYSDIVLLSVESGTHREEWQNYHNPGSADWAYGSIQDEDGTISREEWLRCFAESGVGYVIFDWGWDEEDLELAVSLGMRPAVIGQPEPQPPEGWAFFVPTDDVGEVFDIAIIKSEDRSSVLLPADFDMNEYTGTMVRALYSYPDYVNRYKDDIGTQEIENVYFRAVTDRGVRLLLLAPVTYKDYTPILDPEVYSQMLAQLASRIEKRGYSFGGEYSTLETPVLSPLTQWLTGLVPVALWVFLLTRFKALKGFGPYIMALGLLGTGAACALMPDAAQKLLALGCALGFSLNWVWLIREHFLLGKGRRFPAMPAYLLCLLATLLWALMGGLAVAAIQTDRSYMMGETIFSGVKLSMDLPVFICAIVFGLPILRRLRRGGYNKIQLLGLLPAVIVVVGAMAVLFHRSGQTDNTVSQLENRIRVFFEYAFYARPRTKEILVAVPFMSLLFIFHRRTDSIFHLVGGLCCCLECVSVINTFCHGVAALHVSVIRSLLSVGFGGAAGLIIILVSFPFRSPEGSDSLLDL